MGPLNTTRTVLELRVGSTHTVEVLLQIRASDLAWWNSDLYNHERQLYQLLGRRVLPVECHGEIEADRARMREKVARDDAKKKGEAVIGEANLKKRAQKEKNAGKSKRGKKAKKETKSSKKQKLADKKENNDGSESKEKSKPKLLRETGKWVMGKSIQICYRMEDIERNSASTLIYRPKKESNEDEEDATSSKSPEKAEGDEEKEVPLATFRSWKKLPKRINLWAFKFDPDDPADLSLSEGGGFPRPELLPVADIFRTVGGED